MQRGETRQRRERRREWRVWADTGGTFTDCLGVAPDGTTHRAKVLSAGVLRAALRDVADDGRTLLLRERWAGDGAPLPADFVFGLPLRPPGGPPDLPPAIVVRYEPAREPGGDSRVEIDHPLPQDALFPDAVLEVAWPAEAPIVGAHLLTRTPYGAPLPPMALRVATTRGTNALLTRRGTAPALFVTAGFADLLEIGTQQRPDLFALDIVKPTPLHGATVEVAERLAADGSVLRPLDEDALRAAARALRARGFSTAAVALLHADRNGAHEARAAEILRAEGFARVSRSADLAPFIKILPRAQTAVVNAYLSPVVDAYVGGLTTAAETLHLMTSAGGLVGAGAFRPKDSLLSGPAGGVVGAARAARLSGHPRLIAFDMGGTSTDVARCDAEAGYDYVFEHRVGDAHLVAPALAIESVAAGGGSVCFVERRGLRVGPESAGASPGPACYGAGGPLTVTDVNLLLGRLDPARFEIPIDRAAAEAAADALRADLARETGGTLTREALLSGFLDIANERMAEAIRAVSVARGYDPAEHALVAFGGAGGQHACAVARHLGIRTVLVPEDAGLLSALGIGHAAIERFAERQVLAPVNADTETAVARAFAELAGEATEAVAAEGVAGERVAVRRRIAALRLVGQESALEVEYAPGGPPLAGLFSDRFAAVFGYRPEPDRAVEVVSLRVVVGERAEGDDTAAPTPGSPRGAAPSQAEEEFQPAYFDGAWRDVPVVSRESLSPDTPPVAGPALIAEAHCATVVEPGWSATVDAAGALVLTSLAPNAAAREGASGESGALSPIDLELFTARFTGLAEEMGEMLRRTALSVNVRERLDFSCALLGPTGELVASAAHIPVHLGALGLCVRALRESVPMEPGDVLVTNHPAFGGSHLPDVTVVTPVHDDASGGGLLLGYVASRAHHAEIGGKRPGSMPPDATRLDEEGAVIPPAHLFRAGVRDRDALARLLTGGPYPTRALADNLADIEAAVAANRRGADALRALAAAHGAERLHAAMEALAARADALLGEALARRAAGRYEAADALDDGTRLRVAVTLAEDGGATVDFTGTGPTHPGNLNATPAIVRSAALYVLRLLVNEPLPLNEGLLRRVRLVLPPGSLLAPDFDRDDPANCPAVVGGNTETSQRVVDLLLEALGLAANSQGTMNNLLFGNDAFGYYETVCGGAGATASAPGASAVHTHMTNTRITDPEVLERRCPVRLERFAVRRGSGGAGRNPGGDGVVREITFLAPLSLSLLTQHRAAGPRGREGGATGSPGRQTVYRASGASVALGPVDGCEVAPGDRLVLETPGGGGWGAPPG